MQKGKSKNVRLSSHVIPERYELSLKPDLEAFTFEGQEAITLILKKATKTITLHSKNLEIESAEVEFGKEKIFALTISYDEKAETATFHFQNEIPKGKLKLALVFRGVLNDLMRGFYRSRYEHKGQTKHLATTQFESTDARQAFPCFDEPALKAIFDISLVVPTNLTAISNTMPSNIREHEGGYKTVTFEPTPKMSTYLAAFIVGDFESIEGKTARGTLVRIFTTPGKIHQGKFALEVAKKSLSFFEKYFGIHYPLPALDLIAIPDFQSGAMENWGAITYRETALLYDEEHSALATKQRVAIVIAHEIAHQWFGNLVTMEWWTHLWLNEGFATYIEYLAVDAMFPEWDMWTQFLIEDHGVALQLDALANTHPIEVPVHHPNEISEIFDKVSYSKGGSVIRMLAEYLGKENFRKGLSHYLKKHSYANAETADLWKALEKVSGKPVAKIMRDWTEHPGYPVLQVSQVQSKYNLTQSRFFSSPISEKKAKDKTLWHIPVISKSNNKSEVEKTISNKKTFAVLRKAGSKWTKINYGETGFFRTAYPKEMLESFKKPIEDKVFGPIDRLGIIRDAFALLEAGKIKVEDVLTLSESFKNEDDYAVWGELASGLSSLAGVLPAGKLKDEYKEYAGKIFLGVVKKLGWAKKDEERHTVTLLRSLILGSAGIYGNKEVIKRAQRLFHDFIEKGAPIYADIRGVVFMLVARYGSKKEHETLTNLYKKEKLQEEKNRIGRALANFSTEKLIEETLNFALSKEVRAQDAFILIILAWRNPHGQELTWKFVKKHWDELLSRYGGAGIIAHILESASVFATTEKAKEIQKFFKTHPAPGAKRTLEQAVEQIYSNALWRERLLKTLPAFLKKNK
ncbi:MAG: M1 family metallopeptidase [Candidatus Pacebacteria bacterium]|nr:M1 family metallopeptidase [Candidatus Paceibacterota bacterium]